MFIIPIAPSGLSTPAGHLPVLPPSSSFTIPSMVECNLTGGHHASAQYECDVLSPADCPLIRAPRRSSARLIPQSIFTGTAVVRMSSFMVQPQHCDGPRRIPGQSSPTRLPISMIHSPAVLWHHRSLSGLSRWIGASERDATKRSAGHAIIVHSQDVNLTSSYPSYQPLHLAYRRSTHFVTSPIVSP